jgi:LysM repeat protein
MSSAILGPMSTSPPDPDVAPELATRVPVPTTAGSTVESVRAICPFVLAAQGNWRNVEATGDHRCTAVFPPAPLSAEKQRRLCLTASHESCATFVAALAAREPAVEVGGGMRPMPRTTPVVLERSRFAIPSRSLRPDRTGGQAALVVLLGVAFAGILLARSGSGPATPGAIVRPSASPTSSAGAGTPVPSVGVVLPSPTAVEASPTPQRTLVPTEGSPPPSTAATTYTVQRGDTLSGIAAAHGTTWQVLAQLNHIKDPSSLRVGTVLQLP